MSRDDGRRVSTRYPAGCFAMMRDFIEKGTIGPACGNAAIRAATATSPPAAR